ncbi:MAG: aminopeptidase P family protein [Spirochaetales bacterium]|nr:aminopeptidase P family protein [Spirochaetales bacterium]
MQAYNQLPLQSLFFLQDEILLDRLCHLLPAVMEETGIDMWIVIGDEYNEGPVVESLLPSSFFHARRTAAFLFVRQNTKVVRMVVSKPDFSIDRFYEPVLLKPKGFDWETFYRSFASRYDIEAIRHLPEEDVFSCISRMVRQYNPANIAIDVSGQVAFADGLSKSNHDKLVACLDPLYHSRLQSSEDVAVRWLETRRPKEIEVMQHITLVTRQIIAQLYSRAVIIPGKTTIGEARFFLMESAIKLGMIPWFDATVWIRRKGCSHIDEDAAVINEGDLLHCDFGVRYGKLCSDVQEMAYVKASDDELLIAELQSIHAKAMRLQDILADNFVQGRTGNEVLHLSLEQARSEGMKKPMIYSHPIGFFGHGPGPTIGSFGNQVFVPGSGERILHDATCYAMELNVMEEVPSWDHMTIMYGQEIDILFVDSEVKFYAGRQEQLTII